MTIPARSPGRLVLIVGPSGAGKDTLIDYARERLREESTVCFVRRVITRRAAIGEAHETVDDAEFLRRVQAGAFVLHWQAHGLQYGLPGLVDDWLARCRVVVANGSRAVLSAARRRYAGLLVVNVTAPPEILAERLRRRGREDGPARLERLARNDSAAITGDDVRTLDNSGAPGIAGEQLVGILRDCAGAVRPAPSITGGARPAVAPIDSAWRDRGAAR